MKNRYFIFSTVFCFLYFMGSFVHAEIHIDGEISADSIWTSEGNPYVIDSLLTINPGRSLSIAEGVVISFSDEGRIRVLGTLDVRGNTGNPVIFESASHIHAEGADMLLSHVRMQGPSTLYLERSKLDMNDLDISRLEDMFASSSSINLDRVSIDSGKRIFLDKESRAIVKNSHIRNIDQWGSVFMVFGTSSLSIIHSTIEPLNAAFAQVHDSSVLRISSSTISGMKGYGIRAFGKSSVSLEYVIMSDISHDSMDPAPFLGLWESSGYSQNSIFRGAPHSAIMLFGSEDSRSSLTMQDSTIENYGESGLFSLLADVTIGRSIIRNGKRGVESVRSVISISRSSITNHSEYAALVHTPDFPITALSNFWGEKSGPNHPVLNPPGLGDQVSDGVVFIPWLFHDPFACCSSVLFLPGLKASRLYLKEDGEENRLWEPNRDRDVHMLELDRNGFGGKNVYVKEGDVIEEVYESTFGPNIYKSFLKDMDLLAATGTIREWLPLSYDWRLPFDELLENGLKDSDVISYLTSSSSPYILQELQRMASSSKTGRVTIVAHSNGGLLAKAIARRLEEISDEEINLIDKIILVAVPQTGTPKAIGSLLHGFEEGIPFLLSAEASRRLGLTLPSAYTLLPSLLYAILDSRPFITFDVTSTLAWIKKSVSLYGSQINSLSTLTDFLQGGDGRKQAVYKDLASPSILTESLISKASVVHAELDDWTPPLGIRLIQIAGWGLDTVSGIHYYQGIKNKKPILLYKPLLASDGDGTVMMPSAWALAIRDNIFAYWINLREAAQGWGKTRKHADIFEVPELRELVHDLITLQPDFIPKRRYVSGGGTTAVSDNEKRTRIFVHSSDSKLDIYDVNGNHTGVSTSTGLIEENIPDTTYDEFGDVLYVSLPHTSSPNSNGGSDGAGVVAVITNPSEDEEEGEDEGEDNEDEPESVTVEIEEMIGDTVATSTSWSDISVTASTTVVLDIGSVASSTPVLEIDEDGDGETDLEISSDSFLPASQPSQPSIHQIETEEEETKLSTRDQISNFVVREEIIPSRPILSPPLLVVDQSQTYETIASSTQIKDTNSNTAALFMAVKEKRAFSGGIQKYILWLLILLLICIFLIVQKVLRRKK